MDNSKPGFFPVVGANDEPNKMSLEDKSIAAQQLGFNLFNLRLPDDKSIEMYAPFIPRVGEIVMADDDKTMLTVTKVAYMQYDAEGFRCLVPTIFTELKPTES